MNRPLWLEVAFREIGVAAYPVGSSNPRIASYHKGTNIEGYDDKASWCSSFVNWSLAQAGVSGTASALARSWLDWGEALERPIFGCVTVLWRDDPTSWRGHVGFCLREDEEFVYLLGGNQLEEVREHFYPKATVLGYRWPSDPAAGPLPSVGAA
jgi:uncharacterized protein (TIGR02594 family)